MGQNESLEILVPTNISNLSTKYQDRLTKLKYLNFVNKSAIIDFARQCEQSRLSYIYEYEHIVSVIFST